MHWRARAAAAQAGWAVQACMHRGARRRQLRVLVQRVQLGAHAAQRYLPGHQATNLEPPLHAQPSPATFDCCQTTGQVYHNRLPPARRTCCLAPTIEALAARS